MFKQNIRGGYSEQKQEGSCTTSAAERIDPFSVITRM